LSVRIEPGGQTVLIEAALANKITTLLLLTLVLVVSPFLVVPVSGNFTGGNRKLQIALTNAALACADWILARVLPSSLANSILAG